MQKEKIRKTNERKIYLQLCEAMEALVHICRDGCRTIGPHGKDFKEDQKPCNYRACKGLELLVLHFACCKLRVPGGCIVPLCSCSSLLYLSFEEMLDVNLFTEITNLICINQLLIQPFISGISRRRSRNKARRMRSSGTY